MVKRPQTSCQLSNSFADLRTNGEPTRLPRIPPHFSQTSSNELYPRTYGGNVMDILTTRKAAQLIGARSQMLTNRCSAFLPSSLSQRHFNDLQITNDTVFNLNWTLKRIIALSSENTWPITMDSLKQSSSYSIGLRSLVQYTIKELPLCSGGNMLLESKTQGKRDK